MVSKEYIICPHCKCKQFAAEIIGTSGVVNIFGSKRSMNCKKCEKSFECEIVVSLKFRTLKE